MRAIFPSPWVRKLTGKPVFLTIADCESEARRIHKTRPIYDPLAAEIKAFRVHSDRDKPEAEIAFSTVFRSSGVSLTDIPGANACDLGTFGRPAFFINN